jgi:hypothetical protein
MLGAFSQRWSSVASEHNHRDVSRSRLALQVLNQLPSVTVAQREVRDDDVRMRFPSPAVGLVAISGPDCFETEKDKALDVKFTRVVVIVDDKYQRSGRRVPGTTAVHRFVCPRKNPRRGKYRLVEKRSVAFLTNREREVVRLKKV